MFDPSAFSRRPWRYPSFKNVTKPDQQPLPFKCDANCKCDKPGCPCIVNQTTCEASCGCTSCVRRFPGCRCVSGCATVRCPCRKFGRDCVAGHCACKACRHQYDAVKTPQFMIKESPIFGFGLFAKYDIAADTFLGEYEGRLVCDYDPVEDSQVTRFAWSKGTGCFWIRDCFVDHHRSFHRGRRALSDEVHQPRRRTGSKCKMSSV
jgi:hypothetical protein